MGYNMGLKVKEKEPEKHFGNVETIAIKTMEQPTTDQNENED